MHDVTLLTLPPELFLEICTYLPSRDVNTLRLVFRKFRDVIDNHSGQAYISRRFVVEVRVYEGELCATYHDCDSNREARIEATDGIVTLAWAHGARGMRMANYDEFQGKPLDNCHWAMIQRSGGLARLDVFGNLNQNNLNALRSIKNQAQHLRLFCRLSNIPHNLAFYTLFAPKGGLDVGPDAFLSHSNIVDDRFCQEAASGELHLDSGDHPFRLTDTQLMTFVKREDINDLILFSAEGPTVEGIRNAAQALLRLRKKCIVHVRNCLALTFKAQLLRRVDDEVIEGIQDNLGHGVRYQLNRRVVIVRLLTGSHPTIKIQAE